MLKEDTNKRLEKIITIILEGNIGNYAKK